MSRSYKKHPVLVYNLDDSKSIKQIFNRKIRRGKQDIFRAKGMYRKLNKSWMIHEYKSYCSFGDYLYYVSRWRDRGCPLKSTDGQRNEWGKTYIRK